jgi:hypothetical protein
MATQGMDFSLWINDALENAQYINTEEIAKMGFFFPRIDFVALLLL